MPITHFKTQKDLKKHFQNIIDKIGICESVKSNYPTDYLDFCDVFERHPNYPDKFIGFNDITPFLSLRVNAHFFTFKHTKNNIKSNL